MANEEQTTHTLHDLLKTRVEIAKAFTKDYHEEVKRCVDDYELNMSDAERVASITNINKRYEFHIPYIFATHESMLASMFDRVPDLIFKKRGKFDQQKTQKVLAAYDYLVDKLDLEQFMTESAWWFILTGSVQAHGAFKSEYKEIEMVDPKTDEPMLDEEGNPQTIIEYTYNDPTIEVGDPAKFYTSPESRFSNDGSKVPYYIVEELMDVEEIKAIYDEDVDADAELKVDGLKKDFEKSDAKRAKVFRYYGTVPREMAEGLEDWEYGADCYFVFTQKKIIYKEVLGKNKKTCRFGKWHGKPTSFFGFGIGKTLREVQNEMSFRRGQQIRYADVAAYPKLAVDSTTEIDDKAILDPRENVVLTYTDKPPAYLTPPDLSNTLIITEEKAREDAQFISGMLDISKGSQESNVVKTATGQTMFAKAAERRVELAKRHFGRYYRSVVIMLLELARDNWDENKLIDITDESGEDMEVEVSRYDLQGIDFDTDVDIDLDSITVNKEVLRAQAIELYDRAKDDPIVDRPELFKKMLREGFDEKDPEQFILDEGEMGQDTQGQPTMPLADPSGQSSGAVPSDPSAIMGSAMQA